MNSFDHIPNRRNPWVLNKWTIFQKEILPMWVADMDFPTAPQITTALGREIAQEVLGYEMPSQAYYEVIAARMHDLYGWKIDPLSITYTPGVNNGYNIAVRISCKGGRGYLVQTPVYNEFLETTEKTGVPQVIAPLVKKSEGNRIRYEVDLDLFRQKAKGAGMFLLCNPHNPVGHVFSRDELISMAEICLRNRVTIVSDEIHSELLLGQAKFTPLAGLSQEIEKHVITLISASKAFNIPGLSCAFAIIPDPKLRKKFFSAAASMSFEISNLGLTAARVAYSGRADAWLRRLRRYLTSNRDYLVDYVTRHMPEVRTTIPDATYLAWLDFTGSQIKNSPFEFFRDHAKVALSDGRLFGRGGSGHLRMNFGTSRAVLEMGLKRMRKALEAL